MDLLDGDLPRQLTCEATLTPTRYVASLVVVLHALTDWRSATTAPRAELAVDDHDADENDDDSGNAQTRKGRRVKQRQGCPASSQSSRARPAAVDTSLDLCRSLRRAPRHVSSWPSACGSCTDRHLCSRLLKRTTSPLVSSTQKGLSFRGQAMPGQAST